MAWIAHGMLLVTQVIRVVLSFLLFLFKALPHFLWFHLCMQCLNFPVSYIGITTLSAVGLSVQIVLQIIVKSQIQLNWRHGKRLSSEEKKNSKTYCLYPTGAFVSEIMTLLRCPFANDLKGSAVWPVRTV